MLDRFEVTALLDGPPSFPIDSVVRVVSKDEKARDLQSDFLRAPMQVPHASVEYETDAGLARRVRMEMLDAALNVEHIAARISRFPNSVT
ncbi:hypothetical protein [Caballeronia calidae]|nr:hypothetical protein [Caballeronia calidae]